MVQPATRRLWRPSKLETRVAGKARQMAEREAARVPWPQLQETREKFVAWEAFAFWVRAIEDAEGDIPQSLAPAVAKRCPGFLEFAADRKRHHPDSPPRFWSYLEEWIHERIFGKAWREGWMNAVGYYAARDLASLRNHAYWDYCERQWKRSKPAMPASAFVELIQGQTVRELISQSPPPVRVAHLGGQVARALVAAHAAGIIH